MQSERIKARDIPPTVVRLHPDLRAALDRMAFLNSRSLSKEISARLEKSLEPEASGKSSPSAYEGEHVSTVIHTDEKGPASALSDTDRAMLEVFRKLPPKRQLALLSLFE